MNKKQLIVAWVKRNKQLTVIWITGILTAVLLFKGLGKSLHSAYPFALFGRWQKPTVWSYLAVIVIIGGLSIYTLRDKRK